MCLCGWVGVFVFVCVCVCVCVGGWVWVCHLSVNCSSVNLHYLMHYYSVSHVCHMYVT